MERNEPITGTTRVELAPREIRAMFVPGSADTEKRTVELVWTTGAQVLRYDYWDGVKYIEELSLDTGAVRLDRLNNGGQLLDSHDQWSLRSVIGVVEKAWIANGEGRAIVRLSARTPEIKAIGDDILAGIIRNVSVGYIVHKLQKNEAVDNQVPVWRAIDWEPYEISMVPVPADAGAGTRSANQPKHICEIIGTRSEKPAGTQPQGTPMDKNDKTPVDGERAGSAAPAAPAATQPAPSNVDHTLAERARVKEITQAARAAGMEQAEIDEHIDKGTSADAFRKLVIDKMAASDPTRAISGHGAPARVTTDVADKVVRGLQAALDHRVDPESKLADEGREFRGSSMMEMAREFLQAHNIPHRGESKLRQLEMALAVRSGGYMGTGDFAGIFENVANKRLRKGYQAVERGFQMLASRVDASDFKSITSVSFGDAPQLLAVNENGEFTRGVIKDGKETYKVKSYGRIVGLSRQAMINDDLGALTKIPQKFGTSAANLENEICFGLVTGATTLSDTVAFFHSSRGNLAGGSASINATSIGAARKALRNQKGTDGKPINAIAKYIVVGPNRETELDQFLNGLWVPTAQADSATKFMRTLIPVVTPFITDNAWFVVADPAQIDGMEYAYLDGQDALYLETKAGFEVDGIEIKARHDFGAGLVEYRGWYKVPA